MLVILPIESIVIRLPILQCRAPRILIAFPARWNDFHCYPAFTLSILYQHATKIFISENQKMFCKMHTVFLELIHLKFGWEYKWEYYGWESVSYPFLVYNYS